MIDGDLAVSEEMNVKLDGVFFNGGVFESGERIFGDFLGEIM